MSDLTVTSELFIADDGGRQLRAADFATGLLAGVTFDHMTLIQSGGLLTQVEYRLGGVGGSLEATLTLTYTAGELATVART